MEEAIAEHLEFFGVKPYVIGLYWANPTLLLDNIYDAIESEQPYDERLELTSEELEAFNNGDLRF